MLIKLSFGLMLFIILIEKSYGQKIEKQILKAEQAYDSHRNRSAINACNSVLLKDPKNEKAIILIVKSYIRINELDSAYMNLEKITGIAKSYHDVFQSWYSLGKHYSNYRKNIDVKMKYFNSDTVNFDSVGFIDVMYEVREQNNKKSVYCYLKALKYYSPDIHPIYFDLASSYTEAKYFNAGVEYISYLIDDNTDADNSNLYFLRAKCFFGIDSLSLSKQDYQESLKNNQFVPFAGYTYIGLGEIFYLQKEYRKAIEIIDKGIRSKNQDMTKAYYFMGLSKWAIGDNSACTDLGFVKNCGIKEYENDYRKLCPN